MINPTDDEAHFIVRLDERGGEIRLYGNAKLLNVERLIPEYVTHASASGYTGVFTLTAKGQAAWSRNCRNLTSTRKINPCSMNRRSEQEEEPACGSSSLACSPVY
jgi:hypothetical protein